MERKDGTTYMIKRIRDNLRKYKPSEQISYADWKQIEDRFIKATEFMQEDNFLYQIMLSDLKGAEDIILTNRVHEVKEIRIIGEIQKIFSTDKKEQMDELVGQVKYIRGILAEMQTWIDYKKELESLELAGKIIIHREEEREKADV